MALFIWCIIGLCIGSSLNAFVFRFAHYKERALLDLLETESLALNDNFYEEQTSTLRSYCDFCQKQLQWFSLIPVFSYLFFKGKSSCCQKDLTIKYPIVEIGCSLWAAYCATFSVDFYLNILIACYGYGLIALALCDIEYRLVSEEHIDIILMLVFSILLYKSAPVSLNLLGYLAMYLFFISLSTLFFWLTGRQGIGVGDIKMAGILGLFHGAQACILLILLSSVGALMWYVFHASYQSVLNKKINLTAIPFLPFLHGASFFILISQNMGIV